MEPDLQTLLEESQKETKELDAELFDLRKKHHQTLGELVKYQYFYSRLQDLVISCQDKISPVETVQDFGVNTLKLIHNFIKENKKFYKEKQDEK